VFQETAPLKLSIPNLVSLLAKVLGAKESSSYHQSLVSHQKLKNIRVAKVDWRWSPSAVKILLNSVDFSSNRGFDVLRRQIFVQSKCQKQKSWCMQNEYLNIFHLQTSNIDN